MRCSTLSVLIPLLLAVSWSGCAGSESLPGDEGEGEEGEGEGEGGEGEGEGAEGEGEGAEGEGEGAEGEGEGAEGEGEGAEGEGEGAEGEGEGGGELNCTEIIDCLNDCAVADQSCQEDCLNAGTPEAQAQYLALVRCANRHCSEITDEAEAQACLLENCAKEVTTCIPAAEGEGEGEGAEGEGEGAEGEGEGAEGEGEGA
ncbi:MAG: hypothetical protein RBU45_12135, partial [Myxococcota bacterium]|nr:hypothetical protein [Myxococcota bacterium]